MDFYFDTHFCFIFYLNRVYFCEHFDISFIFFWVEINFVWFCKVSTIYWFLIQMIITTHTDSNCTHSHWLVGLWTESIATQAMTSQQRWGGGDTSISPEGTPTMLRRAIDRPLETPRDYLTCFVRTRVWCWESDQQRHHPKVTGASPVNSSAAALLGQNANRG
jgi:hypothetical protein